MKPTEPTGLTEERPRCRVIRGHAYGPYICGKPATERVGSQLTCPECAVDIRYGRPRA